MSKRPILIVCIGTVNIIVANNEHSEPCFCWHCGSALALPHYKTIVDQLGHEHRVHGVCLDNALDTVRQLTAQVSDHAPLRGQS